MRVSSEPIRDSLESSFFDQLSQTEDDITVDRTYNLSENIQT